MDEQEKQALIPLLTDGVSSFEKGEYDKAADLFTRALDIEASLAHVRTNLGICYLKLEKYELAEKELKLVVEKLPEDFSGHYHLSLTYYYTQKEKEALEECKKALEIDPQSHLALNTMGVLAGHGGEIDEEIKYYKRAAEVLPDFAEAYMNLAYAYQKKFNDEEAISYFRKVIDIAPHSPYAQEAKDMLKDLGV